MLQLKPLSCPTDSFVAPFGLSAPFGTTDSSNATTNKKRAKSNLQIEIEDPFICAQLQAFDDWVVATAIKERWLPNVAADDVSALYSSAYRPANDEQLRATLRLKVGTDDLTGTTPDVFVCKGWNEDNGGQFVMAKGSVADIQERVNVNPVASLSKVWVMYNSGIPSRFGVSWNVKNLFVFQHHEERSGLDAFDL